MPTGREKVLDSLVMVRMPKALRKQLENLAKEEKRALAEFIRLVLEEFISRKGSAASGLKAKGTVGCASIEV